MVEKLMKAYLVLMFAVLATGAAVGIGDEYNKVAASIWCQPGESLVYVWKMDQHGRPMRESIRVCSESPSEVPLFFYDEDGRVRRSK